MGIDLDKKRQKNVNEKKRSEQDDPYTQLLLRNYYYHAEIPFNETPLFKAVRITDYKQMHLLINEEGVCNQNDRGETILHKLASKNLSHEEQSFENCLWQKELVTKCAQAGILDYQYSGKTAISIALEHFNVFLVECLLDMGAKFTAEDGIKMFGRIQTPIMLEILLERCAEQDIEIPKENCEDISATIMVKMLVGDWQETEESVGISDYN